MDELAARRARAGARCDRVRREREVAAGLERLAAEVEGRLDPVVAGMGGEVWTGRAADTARDAALEARGDLARAAATLREAAAELRAGAALVQWRSAGTLPGPPR